MLEPCSILRFCWLLNSPNTPAELLFPPYRWKPEPWWLSSKTSCSEGKPRVESRQPGPESCLGPITTNVSSCSNVVIVKVSASLRDLRLSSVANNLHAFTGAAATRFHRMPNMRKNTGFDFGLLCPISFHSAKNKQTKKNLNIL